MALLYITQGLHLLKRQVFFYYDIAQTFSLAFVVASCIDGCKMIFDIGA